MMKKTRGYVSAVDRLISKNLVILRQYAKVPRSALANHLGICHQQIDKYEKATNRISSARLSALAEYFNIPIQYFFNENLELILQPDTKDIA